MLLIHLSYLLWQPTQDQSWNHEAYLLFPVHLDGTLLDNAKVMKTKKEFFSTSDVLQIFRQVNEDFILFIPLLISQNFSLKRRVTFHSPLLSD